MEYTGNIIYPFQHTFMNACIPSIPHQGIKLFKEGESYIPNFADVSMIFEVLFFSIKLLGKRKRKV